MLLVTEKCAFEAKQTTSHSMVDTVVRVIIIRGHVCVCIAAAVCACARVRVCARVCVYVCATTMRS